VGVQIATRFLLFGLAVVSALFSANSTPRLVHRVEPAYPAALSHQKIPGTAIVSLEVSPIGLAEKVKLVRTDHDAFGKPALDAVSQWRFEPGRIDGQAVRVAATVVVDFRP